jgi:hypothetical protein
LFLRHGEMSANSKGYFLLWIKGEEWSPNDFSLTA